MDVCEKHGNPKFVCVTAAGKEVQHECRGCVIEERDRFKKALEDVRLALPFPCNYTDELRKIDEITWVALTGVGIKVTE